MIKADSIVREPRGISWQDWTARCKDAVSSSGRAILMLLFVGLAALLATLYWHQRNAHHLANNPSKPDAASQKVNLNSAPTTLPTAPTSADPPDSAAGRAQPKSTPAQVEAHLTAPAAAVCNQVMKRTATLRYNTNLTLENSYHQSQLALLGVSGSLTSLLGSDATRQLSAENSRHQLTLTNLAAGLTSQLSAAHCLQ